MAVGIINLVEIVNDRACGTAPLSASVLAPRLERVEPIIIMNLERIQVLGCMNQYVLRAWGKVEALKVLGEITSSRRPRRKSLSARPFVGTGTRW